MGDKNTHFFHQATVTRRRHNRITALMNHENQWVYDDQNLLDMVVEFYKGLYTSTMSAGSSFPCSVSFPILCNDDISLLARPISLDETKSALFSMGNLKHLGRMVFTPCSLNPNGIFLDPLFLILCRRCSQDPAAFRR